MGHPSETRLGCLQSVAGFLGRPPSGRAYPLNTRSLHSTDHRFAMICSGRDNRELGLVKQPRSRQDRT
jgi:hypothetical protein